MANAPNEMLVPHLRFLPRTLPAWLIIILIGTLLVSQTTLFVIMSRNRVASSEIVDLYRLNERAVWLAKLMSPLSSDERRTISGELADSTVVVNLSSIPAVGAPVADTDTLAELEDILVARLGKFGVQDARVRIDEPNTRSVSPPVDTTLQEPGQVEEDLSEIARDFLSSQRYTVSLQMKDGQWVNFVTPVTPIGPLFAPESLPTYLLVSAIVVLVALWAVSRITGPYQLLEAAVARLGTNLNSPPLVERGSRDYRSAAKALNFAQGKLQEHVEERALLAAALAHDLRTPITRMRLRTALLKNSDTKKALDANIADIEETVESVISLAKLDSTAEALERIDMMSMVETVADEYDDAVVAGQEGIVGRPVCLASPTALRRAIRNIVENAISYGGIARLTLRLEQQVVLLLVHDDGPGVDPSHADNLFKPFFRLDSSRNRRTGGSGLGLTIARTLVRRMGGDVTLANHEKGGLQVTIRLLRAADS
ncbi:signal transduction histidine kinase [Rhizobium tibeticum]|uniref:sensor histidine kinase n=1 Tax=Rhizobium tibeticum TaxID=501024 RepID=UPI00278B2077|nr:ATP-binding protein [Rhizobium tibeticum]MDP9813570.1 signal transduction histidine kinase [Rhizobium tibeticum]